MSSSKPNAYRSEEARLQAQRRMLAERYGLVASDDEGDGSTEDASDSGSVSPPVDPVSSSPRVRVLPKQSHTSRITSSITTGNTFNALATLGNNDEGLSTSTSVASTPKKSTTNNNNNKTPTPPIKMSPRVIRSSPHLSLSANNPSVGPAITFETDALGNVPCVYTYLRTQSQAAAGLYRKNPVMCVAKYASQFLPKHGRKIAVNESCVTYVVGGHIRGIVRNSSILSLLKGHTATVCDMEFLHPTEKLLENSASCSVLGSVAEDGVAYVWRLLRRDAPDGAPKEEGTFEIADFVPIKHPNMDTGRKYSRIAFRPGNGSVVADNGIGVAVLLVDPECPDVRIVEMVKMGEKIMARDTTLAAAKESHDSYAVDSAVPASSCLWLDENIVVVARGPSVLLWSFKQNECIGRLPRQSKTAVQALHNMGNRTVLVAVDEGKTLEVWNIPESGTEKLALCQTVNVFDPECKEQFVGVVAVEPVHEIVTVANAKGSYMLVLHYNEKLKAFDALTEVGTSSSMLSTTMTREKKKKNVKKGNKNEAGRDEISMWFFQPSGIFTMTLNAKDYAPKTDAPVTTGTKAFSLDAAQKNKLLESTSSSGPVSISSTKLQKSPSPTKTMKAMEEPTTPKTAPKTVPMSILQPKRQKPTPPADYNSNMNVLKSEAAEEVKITPRKLNLVKEEAKEVETPADTENNTEPNDTVELTKEATMALEDELIETTIESLNKIVTNFREKSKAAEEMESVRTKKLVLRLKEKAVGNVDVAVNTAMKMAMEKIIINNVSEVLTRKIPNEEEIMKTREEYISDSIAASNILGMYRAGTEEILEQIMNTVERSMDDKKTTLIEPALRNITNSTEDISKTVEGFVQQLENGNGSIRANGHEKKEAECVDVRPAVAKLILEGKINEAFSRVLNMCDLKLLDWLLVQFDPKTFFENEMTEISQVIALSLAAQIGHRLGTSEDSDTRASIEWLKELMLYISPKHEEIAESAPESLAMLQRKMADMQKNLDQATKTKFPGIGKQLKQLGLVIMSLAAE